tara:strand:- start:313 stop:489 length:177 start_codon:yes stop_codon:yes gene_type:complete
MTEANRKLCITKRLGDISKTKHAIVWEFDHLKNTWSKEERPEEFGVRPQSILRKTSHA